MIDMRDVGRIERACSTELLRPLLTAPYLKVIESVTGRGKTRKVERRGRLEASDSYMAVQIVVPVDDDETEGIIPLDAIAFARGLGKKNAMPGIRLVGDRAIVMLTGKERASFPRGALGGAWPNFDEIMKKNGATAPIVSIGLNPRLLLQAADALGLGANEYLRLDITNPHKPVSVSIINKPDSRAVVMPVRLVS